MPVEIGMLSTQQDSFERHEELSKLLNETDVFYVPLRGEFGDNNQDLTELTKRFDEDLSNRHLIVTFRDIGYSLSLGSVEKIIDENDQTKIRVSGKNIVDGICVQFLGWFDYGEKVRQHSDTTIQQQQINGVGRIELDEQLYRELVLLQNANETEVKDEDEEGEHEQDQANVKDETAEPIAHKTRQQTAKLKGRPETMISTATAVPPTKKKTRVRTTSENVLAKSSGIGSTSPPRVLPTTGPLPPPPPIQMPAPRPRIHSPGHMPYPLRSPRLMGNAHKQQRHSASSPFTVTSPPNTSEIQSSIESSQSAQPRIHVIAHSSHFPPGYQTTMPIQIPTPSNVGPPPASLPQLANFFPSPTSHSLPAYFVSSANIAYVTTGPPSTNPHGTPFDFASMASNTGMLLIANTNQHPSQPLHIITSFEPHSLPFGTAAQYGPNAFLTPSRTCNILHSATGGESMSLPLQNKRHENAEDEQQQQFHQLHQSQQQMDSSKQFEEQLPFKKRRYAGQQLSSRSRMAAVHNDEDADGGGEEISEEPVRK